MVMIVLSITNNWAAAQPVSMANIEEVAALAKEYDVPLVFDACRFAENAKFIQDFEDGYGEQPLP
jgi:tryptophanase